MVKVLVVDDEQPARQRLISFISAYSEFEVIAEADNGIDAVRLANELKPDLLFLDIQMPKGDGFDVVSELIHDPVIVFATAYDEYAIEAFNVHALDYLLKPYSKERFRQSVTKLKKVLVDPKEYISRTQEAVGSLNPEHKYLKRVSVKDKFVYSIIPVQKIEKITTSNGMIYLHVNEKKYQTDTTLNQFERRLDPQHFMRIHRSSIVNLEKIIRLMPWGQGRLAVVLEDNSSLQVSRERMQEFKERVGLRL
ncbi:MAG: hypothetical protein B6241_11840 [Spirochaetaceae bacterium 4572_59]|nr:MAG: hypothetical protein B6241_11840 [Spirochaetaceae bacterium 4572_59]